MAKVLFRIVQNMANKVTFVGFSGAIAAVSPPQDPPLVSGDVRMCCWGVTEESTIREKGVS